MSKRQRIELPEDILARLRAREEAAYQELIEHVGPALVNFVAQKVGSSDTAQDIVQDVLYQIWQQGDRFTPKGSVIVYLFAAVRNRALNVLKHEQIVRLSHDTIAAEAMHDDALSLAPAVDAIMESTEMLGQLRRALTTLTEHQRTAFSLRYDQELTILEVAEVLGISAKGVERLMTRIRQLLREQFL